MGTQKEKPAGDIKDKAPPLRKPDGAAKGHDNLIPPFLPDEEIVARVKKAGGKIGKVTISLAWKNYNDLDLHVLTAGGEDICYHHRHSTCGGMLDVDQNVSPTTTTPVENVFWPEHSPPKGPLKIYVHHYRNHRLPGCQDPTPFVVRVQIDRDVKTYQGSVSYRPSRGMVFVAEVSLPRTLNAKPVAPPPGTIGKAPFGPGRAILNVAAVLGPADPPDRIRGNCHHKVHKVKLVAGKTYQIDMMTQSPGLDPYLRLETARGQQLAEDDDGGGFPNARLVFTCPATGSYRILCTTFARATGRYALAVREVGQQEAVEESP